MKRKEENNYFFKLKKEMKTKRKKSSQMVFKVQNVEKNKKKI